MTEVEMAEKLVATVEDRRGGKVIRLSGSLDEHNRLEELVESPADGRTLINLAGLDRINSIGTRDWIRWLDMLEARGVEPLLVACSPAFVGQLNRVKNLARGAIVKSFQAPYHCAACDRSKLALLNVSDVSGLPSDVPMCVCDECGAAMMFADDASTYFAFVPEAKRRAAQRERRNSSAPNLARGSRSSASGMEDIEKQISKPRVPSRTGAPSLSVFQLSTEDRTSRRELLAPAPPTPSERPYLLAVVGLLFATVAVLGYLVLMR